MADGSKMNRNYWAVSLVLTDEFDPARSDEQLSLSQVREEVKKMIAKAQLPSGVSIEYEDAELSA